MKLKKPLFNNVVVKILEEEKPQSGLIVPDLGKDKSQIAVVIAVGDGFHTMNGTLIPTSVRQGDIVVVPKLGFQILKIGGEEYQIGKENDLLAILEEETTPINKILEETKPFYK